MANSRGNSDIAAYGERTRFAAGNRAAAGVATARKPLRDAQRQMLAMTFGLDEEITAATILKRLAADGRNTLAHYIAAGRFMDGIAMNGRSEAAIQAMTNDVCGKLPDPNRRPRAKVMSSREVAEMREAGWKRVEAFRQREAERKARE